VEVRVSFLVAGSGDEPYTVVFEKRNTVMTAFCSCPAGERGLHCKHRVQILKGLGDSISSGNESDISTVQLWLNETELGEVFREYQEAERGLEQAKKRLDNAKKVFAKCMHG
jgi:hypothetical protein